MVDAIMCRKWLSVPVPWEKEDYPYYEQEAVHRWEMRCKRGQPGVTMRQGRTWHLNYKRGCLNVGSIGSAPR